MYYLFKKQIYNLSTPNTVCGKKLYIRTLCVYCKPVDRKLSVFYTHYIIILHMIINYLTTARYIYIYFLNRKQKQKRLFAIAQSWKTRLWFGGANHYNIRKHILLFRGAHFFGFYFFITFINFFPIRTPLCTRARATVLPICLIRRNIFDNRVLRDHQRRNPTSHSFSTLEFIRDNYYIYINFLDTI